MGYWIISSKHSRDESTRDWNSKWTADNFLKLGKFYPTAHKREFQEGDKCILKVFGGQDFIGDFRIVSSMKKDEDGDHYYMIDERNEWLFPFNQHSLPMKYTKLLSRSSSTEISFEIYCELMGIRNFMQNLRINYRNLLYVRVSEKELEDLLDAKNALRTIGLEIIERQLEITTGNIIDLLCKDSKGDYVVVELKKHKATETVGQLARYVADVREKVANAGQKVRGLILSLDIDEQLIKAARGVDFDVVLYQLTFE